MHPWFEIKLRALNCAGLPARWRFGRRIALGVIAVQLLVLFAYSVHLYRRFELGDDFATFHQAWFLIAHGHLSPFDTVNNYPFIQNHFELAMWPLSLLDKFYPHSIDLLLAQDVAIAASGAVTCIWAFEVVEAHQDRLGTRRGLMLCAGVLTVLIINPWIYETASFDFHFQPFASLFLVLIGRDLWLGRHRRIWAWVALALITGGVAATYLTGLAVIALVCGRSAIGGRQRSRRGRATRILGVLLGVVSVAWLAMVGAIGADKGSLVGYNYAYLAGRPAPDTSLGLLPVLAGIIRHPATVARVLGDRWHYIAQILGAAGFVGVFSPWGGVVALVVLVPAALNHESQVLAPSASFQSFPVIPFAVIGTVFLLVFLAQKAPSRRAAFALLGGTALVPAVLLAAIWLPRIPPEWNNVTQGGASQLSSLHARIPSGAEVIGSQGVIGRFADREYVYPLLTASQGFHLHRVEVVFIFTPDQGIELASPKATRAAIDFVGNQLHARSLVASEGVSAFAWNPPPRTSTVILP